MNSRELVIAAAKNNKTNRPPVWLMRQAGRYMAAYRKVRERYDFLTMCKTPDIAVEVTLQPIQQFDMDIAIFFSDILTALEPMGVDIQFTDAGGPELDISKTNNLKDLKIYDVEESLSYVPEALRILRKELGDEKALFGFSGAPFTLATYLFEGKHKKAFNNIRKIMVQDPNYLHGVLKALARQMGIYLAAQIKAGADGVQLFDSWAGNLPPSEFKLFALKYQKMTFDFLNEELTKSTEGSRILRQGNFSKVLFIKNFIGPIETLVDSGANVLSIDETRELSQVRRDLGDKGERVALQGNLSPYALYLDPGSLEKKVVELLKELDSKGHIVNLGHGVFPDIPEESITTFVDTVKGWNG